MVLVLFMTYIVLKNSLLSLVKKGLTYSIGVRLDEIKELEERIKNFIIKLEKNCLDEIKRNAELENQICKGWLNYFVSISGTETDLERMYALIPQLRPRPWPILSADEVKPSAAIRSSTSGLYRPRSLSINNHQLRNMAPLQPHDVLRYLRTTYGVPRKK